MKLHQGITLFIEQYGIEKIATTQFLNFLADMRAFDDQPSAKHVLRVIINSGYAEKIYLLHSNTGANKQLKLESFALELAKNYGCNQTCVKYIFNNISYGLRWNEVEAETAAPLANENQHSSLTRVIDVGGEKITLVMIEGGSFSMGATPEQGIMAAFDERPAITVTLSGFYLAQVPVTQRLWQLVMNDNPSHNKGELLPVERVSWHDCITFIKELNLMTGMDFRLPTEAEWEFAARGGIHATGTVFAGCTSDEIDNFAWTKNNSDNHSHEVGLKKPNVLGLHDMSGTVGEWCNDWYFNSYANSASQCNPQGPGMGTCKVYRGGSWNDKPQGCRVSKRYNMNPNYKNKLVGFRLAASLI